MHPEPQEESMFDLHSATPLHAWPAAALDEIDYGLILLDGEDRVAHINHAGRAELDSGHPLQLNGRTLQPARPQDAAALREALAAARQRGLRRLISLGTGSHRTNVSVVPLPTPVDPGATLLMLGKRNVCEPLSVHGFARCHGLTAAETRVLIELCEGTPPCEIASGLGVAISTVRTQIGNVRLKTGAASIRALVRQVAVLPPLMGVLRRGAAAFSA
jgi:DNA-binding CsgD family transcriptional regulator